MTGAIIVVEGADQSGKTTLCRRLVEAHGARCMHSRVWRDTVRWHSGIVRRAVRLRDRGEVICLDRHWISEGIYGPIFHGSCYADEVAEEFDSAICWALTPTCSAFVYSRAPCAVRGVEGRRPRSIRPCRG